MGPGQSYWPRIADDIIERKLSAIGAVSIQGLRGCDKTATAERLSCSSVHLSDSRDPNTAMLARMDLSSVLTSTGYAYKRDDGVIVVPIGCLGP